ncbi:hypothetical protein Fcan01_25219 [Folsomia candida]|uniref:DUF4246 domain-containing protein n=1 Tax=Folsomia candida TaxID=158441 RepID=A0A226D5H2_FOLCA|nr:hypothetical protein Fcan01_25219 [Folsomia candida]
MIQTLSFILIFTTCKYNQDWDVKGMKNERIVAVGRYYYGKDNITPSKLCLAPAIGTYNRANLSTEQQGLPPMEIEITQGRSIVYKNSLSSHNSPIKLMDFTKPGHQKVLTFLLVDPGTKILSTSRVPCEQKGWYLEQVKCILLSKLPLEMVEHIVNFVTLPPLEVDMIYVDDDEVKTAAEKIFIERIKWKEKDPFQPCRSGAVKAPASAKPMKKNPYILF